MDYDPIRRSIFAGGLKAARNRAGLSVTKAATRIAAMGVQCSPGSLVFWERGVGSTREPFASNLPVIASVYGCSIDEFYDQPGADDGQPISGRTEPVPARKIKALPKRAGTVRRRS